VWPRTSLSLIAFGADSLIELVSAGVLLWRLNVELRHGAEFSESVEHWASRISRRAAATSRDAAPASPTYRITEVGPIAGPAAMLSHAKLRRAA
jgi:hypothetical protein